MEATDKQLDKKTDNIEGRLKEYGTEPDNKEPDKKKSRRVKRRSRKKK